MQMILLNDANDCTYLLHQFAQMVSMICLCHLHDFFNISIIGWKKTLFYVFWSEKFVEPYDKKAVLFCGINWKNISS